jgi:hypothetical protein
MPFMFASDDAPVAMSTASSTPFLLQSKHGCSS